ncbi:hypothetical protein UA75_20585 [Actinoalloteichus sp. GBA129-24]|nr:hypothetical protein UA75_20585 [Actinoalloteichus sp. GBA129-24]
MSSGRPRGWRLPPAREIRRPHTQPGPSSESPRRAELRAGDHRGESAPAWSGGGVGAAGIPPPQRPVPRPTGHLVLHARRSAPNLRDGRDRDGGRGQDVDRLEQRRPSLPQQSPGPLGPLGPEVVGGRDQLARLQHGADVLAVIRRAGAQQLPVIGGRLGEQQSGVDGAQILAHRDRHLHQRGAQLAEGLDGGPHRALDLDVHVIEEEVAGHADPHAGQLVAQQPAPAGGGGVGGAVDWAGPIDGIAHRPPRDPGNPSCFGDVVGEDRLGDAVPRDIRPCLKVFNHGFGELARLSLGLRCRHRLFFAVLITVLSVYDDLDYEVMLERGGVRSTGCLFLIPVVCVRPQFWRR